jgi:hypothetical protein
MQAAGNEYIRKLWLIPATRSWFTWLIEERSLGLAQFPAAIIVHG